LEQRTLQFGDTKHLLEMGIQNIEELQRKAKDRSSSAPAIDEGRDNQKVKPDNSRHTRIPLFAKRVSRYR
jgi:hypothetical protein